MNYLKIYHQIIQRAKFRSNSRKDAKKILGYVEKHHIIPKCLGGSDLEENICFLSAREHFIAHFLLVKLYPNNGKLIYACHRLSVDKQGEKIKSSRIFEIIKKKNSEYRKTLNKSNCEHIKRQSEKLTGRTKENNESVRRMAETKSGRTKENDESIRRMAETKSGRTKENHEGTKRQSEKLTGRTKENNESVRRMAETKSKLSLETKIKLVQFRDTGYSIKEIKEWVNKNFPDYTEVSNSGLYKSISNTRKYLQNV
jgi:hypothetical protein